MGAVEHLKTLWCLGLPPESAMVAVTPLLHEIIPHGWSRIALLEPDATIGSFYSDKPAAAAVFRDRMWRWFIDDPSSPMSLWTPAFRANAIGWVLHLQGRGWLESGWYREIETPLDSCWILDAMNQRAAAIPSTHRRRERQPFGRRHSATSDQFETLEALVDEIK
jgi:hypothetical protein